jgi:hypothetical protein
MGEKVVISKMETTTQNMATISILETVQLFEKFE